MKKELLFNIGKKQPKKFIKRRRDPYHKDLIESPSGVMQPNKRRSHKISRHECKKLIKEELKKLTQD